MQTGMEVDRREVLKAGAALLLGFYLPVRGQSTSVRVNAWISIARDGGITLLTEVPEMGQGTRTANAMMLADELEAEWSSIRVEQAPTLPDVYKNLITGGSGGTEETWLRLRKAGAQARAMLVAAAARKWGVAAADCKAEQGTVVHAATGRSLKYGELVDAAARMPLPDAEKVRLKDSGEFRFIGRPAARVDTPGKVDGSAVFGMDVRVPGMLFAVIARCPTFGGKLKSYDDTAAKRVAGVKAVFETPPVGFLEGVGRNLNVSGGVAVVATSTWAAMQGRDALKVTWDRGVGIGESTESLRKQLEEKAEGPASVVAVNRGDATAALAGAEKTVEARYELPFQAHATMEPMNTTVRVAGDGSIEVWSPTQGATLIQTELAQLAQIAAEKVTVHITLSGGSFGRRYQWDYAAEAYQVAKEMKAPVQLVWTREDDLQHDFYRQYAYQHVRGALDGQGNIVAWWQRIVSTPIRAVFDSAESLKDPKHVASQEIGSTEALPYRTANYRSDYAPVESVVPRAWWRSVSSSFQAFATECFLDELSHAAGRDALEYRLAMLRADAAENTAKLRGVLQLAAEKAGWGKALPNGAGRGMACFVFGDTAVAHVAEVSVSAEGRLKVTRVVSAVDCGLAVNPDSVRAQIEGGINYALTPVLEGEITIKEGAVVETNFHSYKALRLRDAPEIEVHLMPGGNAPAGGVGEAGVPPVAPAVANAIFAATGKRVRRLPALKMV